MSGASGFVGANLARRLLVEGHEVHLLLRGQHASWRITDISADVQCHLVDLEDAEGVRRAGAQIRAEWVFHLAAYGAYPNQKDLRQMLKTNVEGTVNLLEACLDCGASAFVNAGSSSEYGFKDHAPEETECIDPNSYYAATKASATLLCRHTAHRRGTPVPTLRLYSVYGPYEEPSRLIPTIIRAGLSGMLPPLANPAVARDFVYISDVEEAFLAAARGPHSDVGAIYNVGTGLQTTLNEVVEVARRVLDIRDEPVWGSMPNREWDTGIWVADNRRIEHELGWRPRYGFAEGFQTAVGWHLDVAMTPSDAATQIPR